MKYSALASLLLFFISLDAIADQCHEFYSNEKFALCYVESESEELAFSPVYDVYAINKKSNNKSFISHEIYLSDVANIEQVNESEYFYKAFIGGNSPPAEHRHVLMIVDADSVKNAGIFSGYADIDNDQTKEYFLLKLSEIGSARAFDKYSKVKVEIKDGKLVVSD